MLITHHGKPVARIEPYQSLGLADDEAAAELVKRGVVSPLKSRLDVDRYLARPRPQTSGGMSVSQIVVEERDEGD